MAKSRNLNLPPTVDTLHKQSNKHIIYISDTTFEIFCLECMSRDLVIIYLQFPAYLQKEDVTTFQILCLLGVYVQGAYVLIWSLMSLGS